ncbi:hypothetical protein LTR37_005019 [Vermiconidia calcicola]|uniref:Uncharacterized protein n=1 Tax=Vermiconidia calcicola TaxID=1690605 RepID=A0ACC3NK81_9PEZI|nr:hypothetical protein LTR37_005019 [Vermiconidia calcicola]
MSAATMQSAFDPQQKTGFLSLPGELRNYIFKLSRGLDAHQCSFCDHIWQEQLEDRLDSIPTDERYTCFFHLHKSATMWSGVDAAFWVNRCSRFAEEQWKRDGRLSGTRTMQVDCSCPPSYRNDTTGSCDASDHGHEHIQYVAQPALTEVSKEIREETLSIFYGSHTFLVTLMEKNIDGGLICKWLKTIGKANAARLSDLRLVYRKKKDKHYIQTELMKVMEKLGVRTDDGVLTVKKLEYPFCYCEGCIRRVIKD